MLVSLPAPISEILLPFFIQISTQASSPQRLRMNHLIQDLIICGMGPGSRFICLLLSRHYQQNTWHTTAIQLFVLQNLPVRQEREPKSFFSKVTELVKAQMPAKFWVYFKAPGLSTVPEESSSFSLGFLPKTHSPLLGGNTLLLSDSEEMPVWALGCRRIRLNTHRPVK